MKDPVVNEKDIQDPILVTYYLSDTNCVLFFPFKDRNMG
jgi:hypothetical protein